MLENKTDELESENLAEKDNSTNETEQTNENAEETQTEGGDVEKKEESVYEQELAELRKREDDLKQELAKKEEIIEHKNRAIESTKKKLKESGASDEKEALLKRLEALESKLSGGEVKQVLSKLTNDKAEAELIEHHYNNSIVRTGDLQRDIQMAMAIANSNVVLEQKRNRALEEGNENFLASFSKTGDASGKNETVTRDPIQRAAEDLVRSINPNAVKFVKEQFKQ
jgi:chromosome segregation ATPase